MSFLEHYEEKYGDVSHRIQQLQSKMKSIEHKFD